MGFTKFGNSQDPKCTPDPNLANLLNGSIIVSLKKVGLFMMWGNVESRSRIGTHQASLKEQVSIGVLWQASYYLQVCKQCHLLFYCLHGIIVIFFLTSDYLSQCLLRYFPWHFWQTHIQVKASQVGSLLVEVSKGYSQSEAETVCTLLIY